MIKWIAASTVFFAFLSFAGAQDDAKKDASPNGASEAKSFAEKMQALREEFRPKQEKLNQRVHNAKTPRMQRMLQRAMDKQGEEYSARFLDIAEQNPNEAQVLWVVQQLAGRPGTCAARAMDILIRHHAESPQIGDICHRLAVEGQNLVQVEKLARAVIEKNRSDDVIATTSLTLARVLLTRADAEKIEPAERTRLLQEAETTFGTVIEKYPKVTVTAAGAAAEKLALAGLFEIRHLQPGQPVPPLKAEDLDAKPFNLSEYRGKVVLLTFWQFG